MTRGVTLMSVYSIATQEAQRSRKAAGPRASREDADVPSAPTPTGPLAPHVALPTPVLGAVGPEIGRALDSIATYIPTEVMATYLAILAIIPAAPGFRYQWLMFWTFLAATPIVVWLGVSAAHPGQGLTLPIRAVKSWPWLSMFAASLAFLVFAVGIPGSVVNHLSWYESWMSTAAIILSAFVLSQVNRIANARRAPSRM